jgi:hypothetical protein
VLRRVIWLPEGTASEHPEQQRFIEALHKDADAQFAADLMIGDIEALKSVVHGALEALREPKLPASPRESGTPGSRLVYIVCDERDRKATIPLRKFLKSKGLDVQIPLFEGDAATVRRDNQDLLTRCDALIVFYGVGDESWKRTVENDLRKMQGYRGDKSAPTRLTYLAEPVTNDKKDEIDMDEPNVINGLGGFSEAAMQPLLETLLRA